MQIFSLRKRHNLNGGSITNTNVWQLQIKCKVNILALSIADNKLVHTCWLLELVQGRKERTN